LSSFTWPPEGGSGGAGVAIYPTFADFPASAPNGTPAIAADTSSLYIYSTTSNTWEFVGPATPVSFGAFGSSPNTDGGSASANVLTLQPADATHPGGISTGAQTLAGVKTFSSAPNFSSLTPSTALALDGSNNLVSSSTTGAELGYVHGVTSAIQTQLNGKQPTLTIGNFTDSTSAADGITVTNGTGAVIGSGTSIAQAQSSGSQNGYLSSTDWTTFNNKQATITTGNLTEATSSVLTITGGTGAVIGSGASIQVKQASGSVSGYLSSTDWTTFNNKQAAGTYLTSVAVASSNGFTGSSSGGATPTITLTTSITGVLKGNGTAISAATAGTDYSAGTSSLATGILKSTTTTGALTIATAGTDYVIPSGSITGTATNITASSNGSLTTLSSLSLPLSQTTGVLPIANGGTDNGSLPVTAGGIIYTDGTKFQNVGAGTANQILQSNGSGAPTWTNAGTNANTAQYSGYYPGSGSNMWSTNSTSYGAFTVNGTIPTITQVTNTNFGTVSNATSSDAGVNFTAPYTGVIKITVGASVTVGNSATEIISLRLYETTTSSVLGYSPAIDFSGGVFNASFPVSLYGYLSVTGGTTYNVVIQGKTTTGSASLEINGVGGDLQLGYVMEYTPASNVITSVSSSLVGALVTYGVYS